MVQSILNFLNTPLFGTLTALFVGSFAYGVYRRQKQDAKQRAASVILLEIEEAEQRLAKVSLENPFASDVAEQIALMPVASWNEYKHLFVHDFDRNETDKISDFYLRCKNYDEAATMHASNVFELSVQELRSNMHRVLADFAQRYCDESLKVAPDDIQKRNSLEQQYIERRKRFIEIYGNTAETHMYTYIPVKPTNDAIRTLQGLEPSLSLTSVGSKLKSIARRRNLFGRFLDKLSGRS